MARRNDICLLSLSIVIHVLIGHTMPSQLAASYLGIALKSPVIVGSCPFTIQPETVRQLVNAGAGAVVLPSMLQEQIVHATMKELDPLVAISRSGYQPQQDKYNGGVEGYLATIGELKQQEKIPIFASLNGAADGEWLEYAKRIQASGADGLELNWQPMIPSCDQSADQTEQHLFDMVRRLRASVSIPLAVKLNQRFTNLASVAKKLKDVGADGLILFTHSPAWDVCIDRLHWTIRWELSPIGSLGGILEGIVRARTDQLDLSIAASGGVCTAEDALKSMIAGADVVMVTSEIYREGPDAVRRIVDGLNHFLATSHYSSLREFQLACPPIELGPERLMRLEYVDPLTRSNHYVDPTPTISTQTGDPFGHRSS